MKSIETLERRLSGNGEHYWSVRVILLDGTKWNGMIRNQAPLRAVLADRTVSLPLDRIDRIDRVDPTASLEAHRRMGKAMASGRHTAEIPLDNSRGSGPMLLSGAAFLPELICPNGCPIATTDKESIRCNDGRLLRWEEIDKIQHLTSSYPFEESKWPVLIRLKSGETSHSRSGLVPGVFGLSKLGDFEIVVFSDFAEVGSRVYLK
ncbi:MAG: hypothetical protein U0800_07040 [Isosphaeraceae bacterium]